MRFEPGRLYHRRDEIHSRFGGQQQGGICTPAKHPLVLLFTGPSGEQYGYSDGWQDDGTFWYCGEGQRGDMTFVGGNKAIRDHAANGRELHLFEKAGKGHRRVRYIGQFVYADHRLENNVADAEGKPRTAIVFELLPMDALASMDGVPREAPPSTRTALRNVYDRSKAVRDAVLRRASGTCEGCGHPAPFINRRGEPYLEPHHVHLISEGGPDDERFLVALCPTCHRRVHYGTDGDAYNARLVALLATMTPHAPPLA